MTGIDRVTGKWVAVQEALAATEKALPSRGGIPGPAAKMRNVLKKPFLDEGDWQYIEKIAENEVAPKSPESAALLRAAFADVSDDFQRAEMERQSAFHEHPDPDDENPEMFLQ